MARYIDADALIKKIFPYDVVDKKCYTINAKMIYEAIQKAPTADVAPKSEVAREIIDEAIRAVYLKTDMKIYNTIDGKPLGDGVAYGKQMAMYDVITLLAELKKKYTEGEK